MLNLFKLNTSKTNKNNYVSIEKLKNYYKYFPHSTREWNNSIYLFNIKTLALIPGATLSTTYLIRGYLAIYNTYLESVLRSGTILRRFRRLSSNKTYVSNGEFKHTSDKVLITLYTYNRQKFNYLSVLKRKYLSSFFNSEFRQKLKERFYTIKYNGFKYLEHANTEKFAVITRWSKLLIKNNIPQIKYKALYINDYLIKFYKNWVKNSLINIKIYLYYRQLLYINESKYNYTYLQILKNFTEKIYNKKVEFSLINIKYHYLNSDILSESISSKIRINRKYILRFFRKLINKIKIHKTHQQEPNLNKLDLIKNIQDPVDSIFDSENIPDVKQVVLEQINYKRLSGVRLEASGRITRRYTAERSVKKIRYKGNLVDHDSSNKGLSSVILKGNLKPNLQYSKLYSKTRIGSFSIKGWVSGS
jgi:Mitochondrial ribosomal protein (VAR1)